MMLSIILAVGQAGSNLDLGKTAGACRINESGPALVVEVNGLRDRTGLLKLEVYPPSDDDFLADDSHLVAEGKVFRRVEVPVPPSGPVKLCVRVPYARRYSVSLLHDRNRDHRFNLSVDGIGFASNPRLGWSKPKALAASAEAGLGLTALNIVLNYRHGLSMRPDAP